MKLSTDIIVLDLEATTNQETDQKMEFQENNFIIEIGAVYINQSLEITSTFQHLVKPEDTLTPFLQRLTGITPDMLTDQPDWSVVGIKFEEWALACCGRKTQNKNIKNIRLAAWGNYFDMPLLRKVYHHYGMKFNFVRAMIDVKTVAFLWCAMNGKGTKELSVEHIAKLMEIKPEGDFHRALTDAEVEAKIFIRAMKDLQL